MSEVKKIKLPQKNTVREFDRWRKEITDATNAEAIHSYYELAKTALNAHAKLRKRVEQLEKIEKHLEDEEQLHEITRRLSKSETAQDAKVRPEHAHRIEHDGIYRCHDCHFGPISMIKDASCESCGSEAFDFIPDKPAQQEGRWECEYCKVHWCADDHRGVEEHEVETRHPVKFIPSPTETPAPVYSDWGKQDIETPEVCGYDNGGECTCETPEAEHVHTVSETDARIQAKCSECGEKIAAGADRVKVISFQHRNCAEFDDEFIAEVKAVGTPEAEEYKLFNVGHILSQAERIVRDHKWLGLANNLKQIAPELLRAWNRRAGTESTHYYEASRLKNHFVEPVPSPVETSEAEGLGNNARMKATTWGHKELTEHYVTQSIEVLELREELVTCRVVIANQIGLIANRDKEIARLQRTIVELACNTPSPNRI